MGEISDAMINGEMCEDCGIFLDGEPPGHPRYCKDCGGTARPAKPSKNDLVFPLSTKVAGISRHQKRLEFVTFKAFFILYREPSNPYDKNAIKVKAWGKHDLGYIPRELAADLAPLLDAGKVSRRAEFVRKNVSTKHPDAPVGLTIRIKAKQ